MFRHITITTLILMGHSLFSPMLAKDFPFCWSQSSLTPIFAATVPTLEISKQKSFADVLKDIQTSKNYPQLIDNENKNRELADLEAKVDENLIYKKIREPILQLKADDPIVRSYMISTGPVPGMLSIEPKINTGSFLSAAQNAGATILRDITSQQMDLNQMNLGNFREKPDRAIAIRFPSEAMAIILSKNNEVFGANTIVTGKDRWDSMRDTYLNYYNVIKFFVGTGFEKSLTPEKNPYADDEARAIKLISEQRKPTTIEKIKLKDLKQFLESKNGLLLIPDSHQLAGPLEIFQKLGGLSEVNWLAIEQFSDWQKPFEEEVAKGAAGFRERINIFETKMLSDRGDGQKMYLQARKEADGSEYPTFFYLARTKLAYGKPLYFIDAESRYSFTGKEALIFMKFFGTVRNQNWAKKIPDSGRGIVLGGAEHFMAAGGINVQDFIRERFPNRPIFLLEVSDK